MCYDDGLAFKGFCHPKHLDLARRIAIFNLM